MKKKITIEIDIDTTTDEALVFPGGTCARQKSANLFEVYIRPDIFRHTTAGQTELVAVAHEIGHVLSMVFETSAARLDPRSDFFPPSDLRVLESYGERVLASETEAWNHAELILNLNRARHECLAGYRETYLNRDDAFLWRFDDNRG